MCNSRIIHVKLLARPCEMNTMEEKIDKDGQLDHVLLVKYHYKRAKKGRERVDRSCNRCTTTETMCKHLASKNTNIRN